MNPFDQLILLASQPRPAPAGEYPDTLTGRLLALIDEHGRISTALLANTACLTSRQVWGLLKVPRERGQVRNDERGWSLNPDYLGHDVAQAVELLRSKGWTVTPPH